MAVLLKDAIAPNLVQTLENNPAFIHGGPFANIAHGCNSVIATTTALKLADYVVTEAGFGADLGAEKFFDIKCRKAGLKPDAAVVVATVRALKMHGGVARDALREENVEAVEGGFANLARHLENLRSSACRRWSRSTASAPTPRPSSTGSRNSAPREGVEAVVADHWAHGGEGAGDLARAVVDARRQRQGEVQVPLSRRDAAAATRSERSRSGSTAPATSRPTSAVKDQLAELREAGLRPFPGVHRQDAVQLLDRSPTPRARRAITSLAVREVRLSAGAEFVVAICGDIMTMPGLPRVPAANNIEVTEDGRITGLF